MNIEEILDSLDELLDRAWGLPLSNGRCVVDADKVRDLIDEIRLNLPSQMKNAKAIVSNQEEIMVQAKNEADAIVKKAEDRARVLISNEEIVKKAQSLANDIMKNAQVKDKELRRATQDFSDSMLKQSEEVLIKSLTDIKNTRQAIKNMQRKNTISVHDDE